MKNFSFVALALVLVSCSSAMTSSRYSLIKTSHLKMGQVSAIGKTSSGQDLFLGGFSGLTFKNSLHNDEFNFYTITDRGPNGYNEGIERPFLLPEFSPQIVGITANTKDNTITVTDILKLKKRNGSPLSGLPNVRTEENPINISGFMISLDAEGMDTEAIVSDDEGGFWIAEEYAPSLAHFDASGKLLRRLSPYAELPKLYSERRPNRGFEAIAKNKNRLFGFLQSPLANEKFSRILEIDLETMKTSAEYFYQIDQDKDRVGDAVSLGNNKFLVVEQNGKKGDSSRKAVYKITLNGPDSLVTKELLIDLNNTVFKDAEKVEGLTLIDSKKIALVNDNDFQIAGKTDSASGMTPFNNVGNEMLILEFSDDLIK